MPTTTQEPTYRIVRKRVASLKPSPENEKLYRPVSPDDPEIIALAESIKRDGLHEPLVITADRYVVSGHRRLAALRLAGQKQAHCRVLAVRRSDLSRDEFIAMLRDHNRQRNKSAAEAMREAIVDADPAMAGDNLRKRRVLDTFRHIENMETIEIEGESRRYGISDQKYWHVHFAKVVIFQDRRDYWPLSVRAVHYALLNHDFYRNSKQLIKYVNDQHSYQATSDLLTRLRLSGEIPWHALGDETRPVKEFHAFSDVREFIKQEIERLLSGYWRDLLQSQTNYVEILCEKNTILPIALRIASKYQVPTTSARGFASIDSMLGICGRYKESGKDRLILLVLSDHDPEGELIPHNAGRILRDDFGIGDLDVIKVGVTRDQVTRYSLPPQSFAKESSSNWQWYTERNGGDGTVWELEALDPRDLLADLEASIQSVLDMQLFNDEIARENEEAVTLDGARQYIGSQLKDLAF